MTNVLKVQSKAKQETIAAIQEIENERNEFQTAYLEADSRANGLEINKQQLHHLLIHIEDQLEEVEGIYQMAKKASSRPQTSDYIDSGLAELRSLIEIAQSHNDKKPGHT